VSAKVQLQSSTTCHKDVATDSTTFRLESVRRTGVTPLLRRCRASAEMCEQRDQTKEPSVLARQESACLSQARVSRVGLEIGMAQEVVCHMHVATDSRASADRESGRRVGPARLTRRAGRA
jgi:hypothetical protein